MSPRAFVWMVFCAAGLAACTTAPRDAAGTRAASRTGSLGILAIERASVDAPSTQTSLGAAFARYEGADGDSVARFLGVGSEASPETCVLRTNGAEGLVTTRATVELLDVGAISVRAGDTVSRLPPRAFPELARVAGGFFYADQAVLPAASTDGGEYVFRTEGSPDLAPFEVVAPGPPDLTDVRLDGVLPGSLTRVQGADVTWDAGDPRDDVEIEVQTAAGTLVCRANDDGSFRLAAPALSVVSADTDARLVVRRVRTTPFDAPGMDEAYVRIAASRQYAIAVH